jgi:hypothetical protein
LIDKQKKLSTDAKMREKRLIDLIIDMNEQLLTIEKVVNEHIDPRAKIAVGLKKKFDTYISNWRKATEHIPGIKKDVSGALQIASTNSKRNSEATSPEPSEPPTPPPSRSASLGPSEENISGALQTDSANSNRSSKATSQEALSERLQNIPLPLKPIDEPKNTKKRISFENYDLNRLYAIYFIYYKLCNPSISYDPYAMYAAGVERLKLYKLNGKDKDKEIRETKGELIESTNTVITYFGEKIDDYIEKNKISRVDSTNLTVSVKILHYSRFNRFFQENYQLMGESIQSLLIVYDCEVELWKDALPPTAMNSKQNKTRNNKNGNRKPDSPNSGIQDPPSNNRTQVKSELREKIIKLKKERDEKEKQAIFSRPKQPKKATGQNTTRKKLYPNLSKNSGPPGTSIGGTRRHRKRSRRRSRRR